MPPASTDGFESLLRDHRNNTPGARERLVAAILDDLRAMARKRLLEARQRPNPLLQPTMVANDTILKLLDQERPIENRDHLMALAGRFMGWILTDYARGQGRTPQAEGLPDSTHDHPSDKAQVDDIVAVRDAMHELAAFSARAAQVVALRTLSGCTIEEVALALGIGHATVERQFRAGLDWLRQRLRGDSGSRPA